MTSKEGDEDIGKKLHLIDIGIILWTCTHTQIYGTLVFLHTSEMWLL